MHEAMGHPPEVTPLTSTSHRRSAVASLMICTLRYMPVLVAVHSTAVPAPDSVVVLKQSVLPVWSGGFVAVGLVLPTRICTFWSVAVSEAGEAK